jgi:hypothetical protein
MLARLTGREAHASEPWVLGGVSGVRHDAAFRGIAI